MRRPLVIGAAALVLLLAALGGFGLLTPPTHVVASRILLAQPAESVWAVVRDVSQLPRWWLAMSSVERVNLADGVERWDEDANGFRMRIRVETVTPGRAFRTVIENGAETGFGGTWDYDIAPAGGGTEVRITERGEVPNPFFRALARLRGHHTTIDDYLSALGARFGQETAPEHLPTGP